MKPAVWPRDDPASGRLLVVDATSRAMRDAHLIELPDLLEPGDLLVVNDAATLPASLAGKTADGKSLELRLARALGGSAFQAVAFGAGDWRVPTEHRPPPPATQAGDRIRFDAALAAEITAVDPEEPRLVTLSFEQQGDALWQALYAVGRPVQYAYLRAPLSLWHTQSRFASRPWAFEAPSAGLPLSWQILLAARHRCVGLAAITHAAGLSSTGSASLDARLPLPERFEVPASTAAAVRRTREAGGRVVAVGTTVVRALESQALRSGAVFEAGSGEATLLLGPGYRRRVVDALLTGLHEPGTSHFTLLEAFAPRALLERSLEHAALDGYLLHEFGDSMLVSSGDGKP